MQNQLFAVPIAEAAQIMWDAAHRGRKAQFASWVYWRPDIFFRSMKLGSSLEYYMHLFQHAHRYSTRFGVEDLRSAFPNCDVAVDDALYKFGLDMHPYNGNVVVEAIWYVEASSYGQQRAIVFDTLSVHEYGVGFHPAKAVSLSNPEVLEPYFRTKPTESEPLRLGHGQPPRRMVPTDLKGKPRHMTPLEGVFNLEDLPTYSYPEDPRDAAIRRMGTALHTLQGSFQSMSTVFAINADAINKTVGKSLLNVHGLTVKHYEAATDQVEKLHQAFRDGPLF